MTSLINPAFPVFGTPTTQSVRDNFKYAKDEIEALQAEDTNLQSQIIPEAPTDGTIYGRGNASWVPVAGSGGGSFFRIARTSATPITGADYGLWLSYSGTYSVPIDAAATLANGWWCYVENANVDFGAIALAPNAGDQIDGTAGFSMYPNEFRILQCDGAALHSFVIRPFFLRVIATASGVFKPPPGYRVFGGLLWGGGGSGGAADSANAGGGGGGACVPLLLSADALAASNDATIGAGGVGRTGNFYLEGTWSGNDGGDSTFAGVTAYGGGRGTNGYSGGGGGGVMGPGGVRGYPGENYQYPHRGGRPGNDYNDPYVFRRDAHFGGGTGMGSAVGAIAGTPLLSVYGGGGGSIGNFPGGASLWGGGGGGGGEGSGAAVGGRSTFGGSGGGGAGVGGTTGVAQDGTAPGGGGGAAGQSGITVTTGAGARGELRLWGIT